MLEVQFFRAQVQTHRFTSGQIVWIRHAYANHLAIWFRFRGRHRYVTGIQDRFAPCVGPLQTISVSPTFAARIHGPGSAGK